MSDRKIAANRRRRARQEQPADDATPHRSRRAERVWALECRNRPGVEPPLRDCPDWTTDRRYATRSAAERARASRERGRWSSDYDWRVREEVTR